MKYSFERSLEILERTPSVMNVLLSGLNDEWVMNNEGPDTFSPYDVIGHLIHGEKTDWRVKKIMILDQRKHQTLLPLDQFYQKQEKKGKKHQQLLQEF